MSTGKPTIYKRVTISNSSGNIVIASMEDMVNA